MAGTLNSAIGIVTGTDSVGRARVRFPWLSDSNAFNARVCKHVGTLTTDTEVVVLFLHGDPNQPVVVGRL